VGGVGLVLSHQLTRPHTLENERIVVIAGADELFPDSCSGDALDGFFCGSGKGNTRLLYGSASVLLSDRANEAADRYKELELHSAIPPDDEVTFVLLTITIA
jgi:hypothetical protein